MVTACAAAVTMLNLSITEREGAAGNGNVVLLGCPGASPSLPCVSQVNLGYLCQACTSLLHSRKMLQHYLQVPAPPGTPRSTSPGAPRAPTSFPGSPQNKNGDGLPSAVTPRVQRPPTATTAAPAVPSSKQLAADTESTEQRALHTVQCGLLKILSRTLAALRHFTPDVCQILLDQVPAPHTAELPAAGHREASGVAAGCQSPLSLPHSPLILLNTTSCLP